MTKTKRERYHVVPKSTYDLPSSDPDAGDDGEYVDAVTAIQAAERYVGENWDTDAIQDSRSSARVAQVCVMGPLGLWDIIAVERTHSYTGTIVDPNCELAQLSPF